MNMTPAVRTAAAYAYATGYLPSFLHIHTWAEANDLLEGPPLKKRVCDVHLSEVRRHPMAVAHDYLISLGYRPDGYRSGAKQRISHYVSYSHPQTGHEALADRGGGVTLITVRNERPYRTSEGISAKEVSARIMTLSEGMTASEAISRVAF
jgi:hypothetical protein